MDKSGKFKSFLLIVTCICLLVLLNNSCRKNPFSVERQINEDQFTGSLSCKECHEEEYAAWMGSHHQLAMQTANDSSILGDFNDRYFKNKGINYHFFRQGSDFMVNTIGEDGGYADYKIKYAFGVIPLQQYIIEFEKGNHQCLLVAWDSDSSRWFNLQPNLDIHHEEWMHWTGGSMTWNNMCADCHSTYVRKNYNSLNTSYDTKYTEISVGCEACHGPGDLHVAYYNNEEKNKSFDPPDFYMPANMSATEIVQKCARCHSRRAMMTSEFDYKGHFLDHYYPNLLQYPTYERDGQILDEDYVYGSFMQSKMYHNGITCRDCHDMHSMEVRLEGNMRCLLCHEPRYNTYEHHFHKMDTEAALCINCHMTGRYYMGNDFRRDHSFRNPRPDQSVIYGSPNACMGCHQDKTNQWAMDFVIEKYGTERPYHFSDPLLAGLEGDMDSMRSLLGNDSFPEIIRASAIEAYAAGIRKQEELQFLINQLADSSAMVRRESILALINLEVDVNMQVEGLLADSIRAVRVVAARYFLLKNLQPEHIAFEKARKEFLIDLEVNSDFASGNHQWALYYQAKGDTEAAMQAYREALRIDNYFNASRMNLALLEYNKGRVSEAELHYLKVIEQEPNYSYPWFMLGLLFHETGDHERSLQYLEGACQREPFIIRAHYNYALKLFELKQFSKTLEVLDKALNVEAQNESFLYLKLLLRIETKDTERALGLIEKLVEIAPENQDYQAIKNEILTK